MFENLGRLLAAMSEQYIELHLEPVPGNPGHAAYWCAIGVGGKRPGRLYADFGETPAEALGSALRQWAEAETDIDPMEPDYEALAEAAEHEHPRHDAEPPGVK